MRTHASEAVSHRRTSKSRRCERSALLESLEARQMFDAGVPLPGLFDNGREITSVVTADFDNDGDLDMAVAAGRVVGLLLNNGDGTFAESRRTRLAAPAGVLTVAGFNEDQYYDLAAAGPMASRPGHSVVRVLLFDLTEGRFVKAASRVIDAECTSLVAINMSDDSREEFIFTGRFADGLYRGNLYTFSADGRIRFSSTIITRQSTLVGPAVVNFSGVGNFVRHVIYVSVGEDASAVLLCNPLAPGYAVTLYVRAGPITALLAGDLDRDTDADVVFLVPETFEIPGPQVFVLFNEDRDLGSEQLVYSGFGSYDTQRNVFRLVGLSPGVTPAPDILVQSDIIDFGGRVPPTPFADLVRLHRGGDGTYSSHTDLSWRGEGVWHNVPSVVYGSGDFTGEGRADIIAPAGSRLRLFNFTNANGAPVIEQARHDRPNPVRNGGRVIFRALVFNPEPPGGEASNTGHLRFFLDVNGNGEIDDVDFIAATAPLSDTFGWDGAIVHVAPAWPRGTFDVLAQPTDGDGLAGPVFRLPHTLTLR